MDVSQRAREREVRGHDYSKQPACSLFGRIGGAKSIPGTYGSGIHEYYLLSNDPAQLGEEALQALNKEILLRLQEEGIASPSSTILNGKYTLRIANVNQRTRKEDMELLVREVLRIGMQKIAQD